MAIRKSIAAFCISTFATAAPATAQIDQLADLDILSRTTTDAGAGLALARQQIARGELMGAVATTERIIALHPESDDALLLHASLLCRLDDLEGARTELAELPAGRSGGDWSPVIAACGPGFRRRG